MIGKIGIHVRRPATTEILGVAPPDVQAKRDEIAALKGAVLGVSGRVGII